MPYTIDDLCSDGLCHVGSKLWDEAKEGHDERARTPGHRLKQDFHDYLYLVQEVKCSVRDSIVSPIWVCAAREAIVWLRLPRRQVH